MGPIMGPVGFRKPCRGPKDFRGPIEMTLRNQHVEDERRFFLRSHQNLEKTVAFFLEDLFFFGDHIKIRTKLWHFSRLFWSSQNRRSVIFELTPDQRSAIGAPAPLWATAQSKKNKIYFKIA